MSARFIVPHCFSLLSRTRCDRWEIRFSGDFIGASCVPAIAGAIFISLLLTMADADVSAPLPSARRPELVRRGAGLLAEEPGEVGGIGECEIVGDLVNRLTVKHELALGFGEHALADEVTGVDTGGAPDMIVETID